MTNRFIARFGEHVAIMHSGLSDGEKYDEWRKSNLEKLRLLLGQDPQFLHLCTTSVRLLSTKSTKPVINKIAIPATMREMLRYGVRSTMVRRWS
jgi:hypothetical protein